MTRFAHAKQRGRRTRVRAAALVLGIAACTTTCRETPPDAAVPRDTVPQAGELPAPTGVTVFFTRDEQRVGVARAVPADSVHVGSAIRALLRGPAPIERERGITSWFSAATADALHSVKIDADGHAIIDFRDLRRIIPNASTSAGSAMLLGELNATVFEFQDIQSVEYRIDGSCAAFGDWLQYGCEIVHRPQP